MRPLCTRWDAKGTWIQSSTPSLAPTRLASLVQHCWCGFQRLDQSPGRTPQSFEDECYILMPWLRGSGPKFWSISQLSACNKTSKCCDTDFNTLHNLHNTSWTLVCLRVLNHSRKTNCSGQKHPSTRRPNLSYLICSFQFAESIIPLGLTKAELGFFLFSITKESESNIRSFSATGGLKVLGFIWQSLQLTLQPMSTHNALFAIYEIFSCQDISQTSECHQRHKLHTAQVVDLWQQALAAAARSPPLGRFQFQQHSSLPVLWRTHVDRFYGSLPDLFNHCNSLFLDLRSIDSTLLYQTWLVDTPAVLKKYAGGSCCKSSWTLLEDASSSLKVRDLVKSIVK